MIIWSGRGFFILVYAAVGYAVGGFVQDGVENALKIELAAKWTTFFAIAGAAIAVWIFTCTGGRADVRRVTDRTTGNLVQLITKHRLLFVTPVVWAVFLSCFALLSLLGPSVPREKEVQIAAASAAGRAAFNDADNLIVGRSRGVAHGNTAEAKMLAAALSAALKEVRNEGIEQRSRPSTFSTTKGDFITYCLLQNEHCVFMVHVPDLRHFASDAKDLIADAAWIIALKILEETGLEPRTLAVGLRGVLMYDRVCVGRPGPAAEYQSLGRSTVVGDTDSTAQLALLFDRASRPVRAPAPTAQVEVKAKAADSKAVDIRGAEPPRVGQTDVPPPPASAPASPPVPAKPAPVDAPMAADFETSEPSGPLNAERTWTDVNGRTMKASFVRFTTADQSAAEFKRADGHVFVVPLDRFSAADQAFAKEHPDLKK